MTIEKITLSNELTPAGMVLVGKVHEIIDVVNSLTGGEKEEPKSNTLREEVRKLVKQCVYVGEVSSEKISDQILSLVKEHLEKEINQSLKETKYDDNDREWAAKLQYNKAIYDIKQIIKNL